MSKTSKWLCIGMSLLIILCSVPLFLASASDGPQTNLGTQWSDIGSWENTAEGRVLKGKNSKGWGRTFAVGTVLPKEDFTAELQVSGFSGVDATQLQLEFGIKDTDNPTVNAEGMTQIRIQNLFKEGATDNICMYAFESGNFVRKAGWTAFPAESSKEAFTIKLEVTVGETSNFKIYIDGTQVNQGTLSNYDGGYLGVTTLNAELGFTIKKFTVTSASLTPSSPDSSAAPESSTSSDSSTPEETPVTTDLLGKTWTAGYGTWEQAGGKLNLTAADKGKNSGVFLPGTALEDEDVTAEMKISGFTGLTADIANPMVKLVFGLGDSAASSDPAGTGIFDVRIQGGKVAVYEWNGSKMAVATGSWKDAVYGESFTLKVVRAGTSVTVSIDGTEIGTWTLGRYSDTYTGGTLGIATWGAKEGLSVEKMTITTMSSGSTSSGSSVPSTPSDEPSVSDKPASSEEVLKPVDLLSKTWKAGYGTLTQKNGKLILAPNETKDAGAFLPGTKLAVEPTTVEMKVSGLTGLTADITNPMVKLIFGVGSAVPSKDPAAKGIFDVRIQGGKVAVYEWNADFGKLAASTGGWKDATYGESFLLKVVVDGSSVTVSIDGTEIGTWTLGRFGDVYKGGSIGVASWGAKDGLTIEKLDVTAASLQTPGEDDTPKTGAALPITAAVLLFASAVGVVLTMRVRKEHA